MNRIIIMIVLYQFDAVGASSWGRAMESHFGAFLAAYPTGQRTLAMLALFRSWKNNWIQGNIFRSKNYRTNLRILTHVVPFWRNERNENRNKNFLAPVGTGKKPQRSHWTRDCLCRTETLEEQHFNFPPTNWTSRAVTTPCLCQHVCVCVLLRLLNGL